MVKAYHGQHMKSSHSMTSLMDFLHWWRHWWIFFAILRLVHSNRSLAGECAAVEAEKDDLVSVSTTNSFSFHKSRQF